MPRENVHQFIIEKIEKLQSALFFPETPDRIIPACVLQQIETDEQAQIWFAVPRPAHAIDPTNTSFPCRMDFFRKGEAFHVKISGMATIMDEAAMPGCPQPLTDAESSGEKQQLLVIKVQIQQADHFNIPPIPLERKNNTIINLFSNTYSKITGQLFGKMLNPAIPAYH